MSRRLNVLKQAIEQAIANSIFHKKENSTLRSLCETLAWSVSLIVPRLLYHTAHNYRTVIIPAEKVSIGAGTIAIAPDYIAIEVAIDGMNANSKTNP